MAKSNQKNNMKATCLLLISLLLINCKILNPLKKETKENDGITIKFDNKIQKKQFALQPDDEKKLWKLTNLQNKKEFVWSYKDMKIMLASKAYWKVIQEQQPEITKIETTEFDYVIYINYIDPADKTSVLGAKILINKDYIRIPDKGTNKYLMGGAIATGVYAIIVTLILVL